MRLMPVSTRVHGGAGGGSAEYLSTLANRTNSYQVSGCRMLKPGQAPRGNTKIATGPGRELSG